MGSREPSESGWSEGDTDVYARIAPIAVPRRAEQLAALACLVPFRPDTSFSIVELGSGTGALSATLLECFPQATLLALDGSPEMRAQATRALAPFESRARVEPFDLAVTEWFKLLDGAGTVVSSLCLHHLDDSSKRRLFTETAQRLDRSGALLIADLIAPQRPEALELFAGSWDADARAASEAATGSSVLFEEFVATEWNHYRYPDPMDKPSPLSAQLQWLKESGFAVADCFWMRAGHAVYGGYMSPEARPAEVTFAQALGAAHWALDETG